MKKIVFPEGEDERIIEAAKILKKEKIAEPVLIGKNKIERIEVINPETSEDKEQFAQELSKITGYPSQISRNIILNPLYFGAMALKLGKVDGMVGGCVFTSAEFIAVSKQIIGLKEGISVPSSFFLMEIPDYKGGENGKLIFSDASVNIDPTPEELADIAITTGNTAKDFFGWEPRVALLSFSTHGSASHLLVDKVVKATKIARKKAPEMAIEGELQADAALREDVAKRKMRKIGKVVGNANILIFPDLNAGNIAYKLVNILAGARALGPILQGFRKPLSDLSRGAKVEEIVEIIKILTK
ncbi:MAG: phosphate acetyltransferase [Candidatus Nealsonbacteria bacterium CG08_land_8_20_14_0_20_38_20]|uniref:Phosphate acetyltransferase n=1 Tax=Candidatus Nealsonbacteria bacterium CG08_land_8_20_14_0_20_38_20 TaxID=1974705 RepID=A0A2H0YLN7_9BACT|nr:MAG: phosphate acetyltransferase [Candidatus Nealsonbacteria bacterium CG08_land_8_20_14_0_20_38_20]